MSGYLEWWNEKEKLHVYIVPHDISIEKIHTNSENFDNFN